MPKDQTSIGASVPSSFVFRIVVPIHTLAPGEEQLFCASWQFPQLHNTLVYAARLYTTPGLHHSNVISLPPDPTPGYGGSAGVRVVRDWIEKARSGRGGLRSSIDWYRDYLSA